VGDKGFIRGSRHILFTNQGSREVNSAITLLAKYETQRKLLKVRIIIIIVTSLLSCQQESVDAN